MKKPKVVCLCGSTKFKSHFEHANLAETLSGNIVLSVAWFGHADSDLWYPGNGEKLMLDEVHKRKIDLADEILVINPFGYIGQSTRSEISYARKQKKQVRFLYGTPRVENEVVAIC